jgi:hypothetical protein
MVYYKCEYGTNKRNEVPDMTGAERRTRTVPYAIEGTSESWI